MLVAVVVGEDGVGLTKRLSVSGTENCEKMGEIRAYLVLEERVDPSVVDAQGNKVDLLSFHRAGCDRGVLRFEVGGELGAIVAAVRLGPDGEVTAFYTLRVLVWDTSS